MIFYFPLEEQSLDSPVELERLFERLECLLVTPRIYFSLSGEVLRVSKNRFPRSRVKPQPAADHGFLVTDLVKCGPIDLAGYLEDNPVAPQKLDVPFHGKKGQN